MKTIILYLTISLSTFNCSSFKSWKYLPKNKSEETYIYVVSHGWYTGVVILNENLGR